MKRLTTAIAITAALAAFGCSKEPPAKAEVSAADVTKQASEAADTAAQYAAQEKDEFVRASRQQLDQLKKQLGTLNEQAKTASGEARKNLEAQIDRIEAQMRRVEASLAELAAAGAERWREAKASFVAQMQELKQSFEQDDQQRKQG